MTKRRRRSTTRGSSDLKIIPLGGLGEFGLNCMVVEYGSEAVVIDAGLLFPEPEQLGVDYVIPDFSYLFETPEKVRAILLTHGHEDHIGALPYLLRKISAPVFGTAMTLGLVNERLKERGLDISDRSHTIRPPHQETIGNFTIHFLRVNHSIPGAVALAIDTPEGTVLHTGDFKVDLTPVDGKVFDFQGFAEAGKRGILALLSDSTNVERSGHTPSESLVSQGFEPIFQRTRERILITTFASHIHRIQQILNLAARHGRKVCLIGRSLQGNAQVAASRGYLTLPRGVICQTRDLRRLPPGEVVLLVTGSQGEPMSALSRIALDNHRDVKLCAGDLVILSAREIPGNERAISRMVDHLLRRGAEVIMDRKSTLHTSGHASQEELKTMLRLCNPKHFIPIHGDYRHLARHAELVAAAGHPRDRIFLAGDGDVISFGGGKGRITGKIPVGRVFIDAGLDPVDEVVIRDRRHISEDGILMAVVAINRQSGELQGDAEIVSRGLSIPLDLEEVYRSARAIVRKTIEESSPEERADWGVIRAKIQTDLKRYCRRQLKRHPMILPVIMEV